MLNAIKQISAPAPPHTTRPVFALATAADIAFATPFPFPLPGPGMSTRFFTNDGANTLIKKFAGVFAHNPDIERFDALVGYLRASGYFALRPHLEKVPFVRILVGIDVDEMMRDYHQKGLLFLTNSGAALDELKRFLLRDIQSAEYRPEIERGILQFVEDVGSGKLQVRAHPTRRLHAKIYIFRPKGFNEHKAGAVITGSSNLTGPGLGEGKGEGNYEFNVLLHDFGDVQFATAEFEKLWEEGIEVLPATIREVQRESYLNRDFTPFELYIKFLIEYFGSSVEFDPSSVSDLPEGFLRLSYQIDAVNQGFDLLRRHGGFFLADVVGLGKTIIAALIAKKFFYFNDFPAHISTTLIIVPPALKDAWDTTLRKFELKNFKIVTNGSVHKEQHPEEFDLVIVDEAHKFRNDESGAYDALQRLCKTPTKRRLPDGSFAKKCVILVSATPLNNRPEDIRNLTLLFQDGKDSTVEGTANLQSFFATQIKAFDLARQDKNEKAGLAATKAIYELIRTRVVEQLTIRRTRRDLMEHDLYKEDLKAQGIVFPYVEKPRPIYYVLDPDLESLYDRTMHLLAPPRDAPAGSGLTYNRYRAIGFLKPEKKLRYQNADLISTQLARIMKTMLVKRIDSSFFAFTESLNRFAKGTHAMLKMLNAGRIFIAPNLPVADYILDGKEEELLQLILDEQGTDPTIAICGADDFKEGFREGLEKDAAILDELTAAWGANDRDPKLDKFLVELRGTLFDEKLNHARKLVIFSEAKDTTDYIADALKKHGFDKVLAVDSTNRKEQMPVVRANFDANIPAPEQRDDFRIVISTEVLAEGVNLHRANVIVNYDTPWNSTRLMQRIGRVNRIGTTAPAIHIFNFYPTARVNSHIELERKAIFKLQAFHSALGEDSQIYSPDEEVDNFGLFDKEVEEERDERLQWLGELRKYRAAFPDEFRRIRNLPLRARVGRLDASQAGTTLVFIRNRRRDAFHRVGSGIEEISFVEMARAFRAEVPEQGIPLHDAHHDHVNAALAHFDTQLQSEAAQQRAIDTTQSPHERRALRFLDELLSLPSLSASEKSLMRAAKLAVRKAQFQKLQRELGKLEKAVRKPGTKVVPAVLIDKAIALLSIYPLHTLTDDAHGARPAPAPPDRAPDIILSESFSASPQGDTATPRPAVAEQSAAPAV